MFEDRIYEKEIIDDLEYSSHLIISNFEDIEFLNRWLGFNRNLVKCIEKVYTKYKAIDNENERKIVLADLGCGSGDALRYIADWMRKKKYSCELIGIDGNEFVINYGKQRSVDYPEIQYSVKNILLEENYKDCEYDVIMMNNICHHFNDEELVRLMKILKRNNFKSIIVNDLHRNRLAYLGIKLLNKLFRFSSLTQNDGPLSVRKGFKREDWKRLMENANIEDYDIRWTWPFRWQVMIGMKIE